MAVLFITQKTTEAEKLFTIGFNFSEKIFLMEKDFGNNPLTENSRDTRNVFGVRLGVEKHEIVAFSNHEIKIDGESPLNDALWISSGHHKLEISDLIFDLFLYPDLQLS